MKKIFYFFGVVIIILLVVGQCSAQCTSTMSVFMPPRVEASETKILETFPISEIPFFISRDKQDSTIVYVFSGNFDNCSFLASAPAGKLEQVKKQITEKGAEVGIQYRKMTFHCYEEWKEYFR